MRLGRCSSCCKTRSGFKKELLTDLRLTVNCHPKKLVSLWEMICTSADSAQVVFMNEEKRRNDYLTFLLIVRTCG